MSLAGPHNLIVVTNEKLYGLKIFSKGLVIQGLQGLVLPALRHGLSCPGLSTLQSQTNRGEYAG